MPSLGFRASFPAGTVFRRSDRQRCRELCERTGALSATLESGSHFDKSSNDVAYKAAVSLLSVLEMVEPSEKPAHTSCDIFEMYDVVLKGADDFRYPGQVRNFQFVKANDVFAFEGGNPRRVPEDSYLLIPMKPEDTKVHEEVCYLGRKAAQA